MVTVRSDQVAETAAPPSARLVHLDNLKIVLTAGVIVAHAAMTYGAEGTWIYEDEALSGPLEGVLSALVGMGVLFGLGLFFLMAGMLTTGPLQRRGPRRFLASRLWRLGLPLLLYAAVVWPVLRWWIDHVEGDETSLPVAYRRQFTGSRWRSLGTGPLWFVAILLVVTTGWALWRWARPATAAAEGTPLPVRGLVAAVLAIAIATFVVRIPFPIDSPQFLDAHVWLWPQAGAMFVLGAVGAERGWFTSLPDGLRRHCWQGIAAAVAAFAVMVPLSSGPDPFTGGWHWEAAGFAACEGVFAVSVSMIVLDRFRRRHARQGRFGRLLADAAYLAFVAQGPVLVVIALALRSTNVPGDIKFLVLAPVAVAASFGLPAAFVAVTRPRHGVRAESSPSPP